MLLLSVGALLLGQSSPSAAVAVAVIAVLVLVGLNTILLKSVMELTSMQSATSQGLRTTEQQATRTKRRLAGLDQSSTEQDAALRSQSDSISDLQSTAAAAAQRQAEATRSQAAVAQSQADALERHQNTIQEVASTLRAESGHRAAGLTKTNEKLTALSNRSAAWHSQTNRRIDRERSSRLRSFAARDSLGRFPEVLLLQVTLWRTASTRLFDMLRTHPAVYVEPLPFIWDALQLSGNRYPAGLANQQRAGTAIVNQGAAGVAIPSLTASFDAMPDAAHGRVAVEKAHPHFFGFDSELFSRRLSRLEDQHQLQVVVIYQTRAPLDVMWSMAEYKQRDPTWQGSLEIADIPDLVARSYSSLNLLASLRPGAFVDFDEMSQDRSRLSQLARLIDPTMTDAENDKWAEQALSLTDRKKLESTAFVGPHGERVRTGPDNVWASCIATIDQADSQYRAMRSRSRGPQTVGDS